MNTPIRVVTVGLPPFQEDLIQRTLAADSKLSVVGSVPPEQPMSEFGGRSADVMIIWAPAAESLKSAIDFLTAQPGVALVLLAGKGDAFVEARVAVGTYKSWPMGLIEAIYRAARQ